MEIWGEHSQTSNANGVSRVQGDIAFAFPKRGAGGKTQWVAISRAPSCSSLG